MQTILTPVELQPAFFYRSPETPVYFVRKIELPGSVLIERLIGVICSSFLWSRFLCKSREKIEVVF